MDKKELEQLVEKSSNIVQNNYLVASKGWYGDLYRFPYSCGILGSPYNITRASNDCGTAIFSMPELSSYKFDRNNIPKEDVLVIFVSQLYILTGAFGEESRKVIFTGFSNFLISIENLLLENANNGIDLHHFETYKAHNPVLQHDVWYIGLRGKNRNYWINQYITLISKYWNLLFQEEKAGVLVLLNMDRTLRGSYAQKAVDFNFTLVNRDLDRLIAMEVKPETQNLFSKEFIAELDYAIEG